VRTNLFIPSRFWTTHTKIDNYLLLLSALYSKGGNFFYIGAHLHAFSALNNCDGIFFKSLSYLYEVVRTNFSAYFGTFRNFDGNFAKIVASSRDKNENYVVPLKDQSLLKKS